MTPQEKQDFAAMANKVSELSAQVQVLTASFSQIQQDLRDQKIFAAGAASTKQSGGFPSISEILPYKMLGIL